MEKKGQKGITGLETAIVLIAFVMVASVFAYVVLSAGLFSSQKAKEAVYQGMAQTSGSVCVKGNVFAQMAEGFVTELYIPVSAVSAGNPIDFTDTSEGNEGKTKVAVSYSDTEHFFPAVDWTLTKVITVNDDNLLDENELFLVTVDLTTMGTVEDPVQIGSYQRFTIEIKPPTGAVLPIERSIPGRVNDLVNLY
jgi:archaeal flagellin FlaB